ncbi:ABC transporter ATP-binding protein [Actinobacteria bacterium YIM 96077]|uniref:ABC transporter ATP-binding protein n=1 Tax=Phytoactinopolyspora halophila TaxID=1981511 RepID=A0A329QAK0_9ACTN|nr:ABC transporter ATP-binding protein [Phytoactinopolyspora halophila]AYY13966.1 ABC transporter ATP-binding protein [Actinobacteria bacterium YIM 96077]RAW09405.1 ABC transporter ATP-binding protein [Phytoactinopolyspora halophila]
MQPTHPYPAAPQTSVAAEPGPPAPGEPLLRIEDLRTHFFTDEGVVKAVDGMDLTVPSGKTVCVVGESGCGKSITARSILQLVDQPGRIVGGAVYWRSGTRPWTDLATLDATGEEIRQIRGDEIGMVFQEPMASLSPMYTVGAQLSETLRLHRGLNKAEAREKGIELLRRVGIPRPERRFDSYSFQLSGGMCQRVMIAIALSCDPALLIADEPTTALDVTTQARIIDLLKNLQEQNGMAMVFITHDLGVVAEIADEVTVMYLGTVAEHGTVDEIFGNPKHPYTRALLSSIPTMRGVRSGGSARQRLTAIRGMVPHPQNRPTGCPFHTRCELAIPGTCDTEAPPVARFDSAGHLAYCHLFTEPAERRELHTQATPSAPVSVIEPEVAVIEPDHEPEQHEPDHETHPRTPARSQGQPLLDVQDLTMHFPLRTGLSRRARTVVRAVDGVDLTIHPGETLGLVGESGCGKTTLGRCIARLLEPTSGHIYYRTDDGDQVDLTRLRRRELHAYRQQIRVIFQDPYSSLNPRMTLGQIIGEPLRVNRLARGSELEDRVADMLSRVGLRPEYIRRYPHAFSGGERQRINIARALVTNPRLVIADEAVSALDVSVRAQILNLLVDLQAELDLTYLFVSHDLSVVEHISDRVTVMYLGNVVESADTSDLYRQPHHPYTEALMSAVPLPDPGLRTARHRTQIPDDLPDPTNPPPGCPFHPRCPHVRPDRCRAEIPELRRTGDQRLAACHHSESLTLTGVS